jgi:hypothetical protein
MTRMGADTRLGGNAQMRKYGDTVTQRCAILAGTLRVPLCLRLMRTGRDAQTSRRSITENKERGVASPREKIGET